MTSKERARLRALASVEPPIVQIGKSGITDAVVASVETALAARELVKGRVLESSMLSAREACSQLAVACSAEAVQSIGSCFVLFRPKPSVGKMRSHTKESSTPEKRSRNDRSLRQAVRLKSGRKAPQNVARSSQRGGSKR